MNVDVSSLEFHDADAFREHLSGWDLEIVPLSPGGISLFWQQVAFDDMVIAHHGVRGAFADISAIHPGWLMFVVCLAPTGTIWCGFDLAPGHLLIMAPGREHRTRIEAWRSLEIIVAAEVVEDAGILSGAALPPKLAPERCLLPIDRAHAATFRALARSLHVPNLLELGLRDDLLLAIRERTLETLASAVAVSAAQGALCRPTRSVSRYDLALRALAIMDASEMEPPGMAELAAGLGVTERTLQYALKQALGVSPYQYLLARRLQRVRRDLLRRRTTITMAAFDHGFENLGRFAAQYQRLFGERPSDTLQRIRSSPPRVNGKAHAALAG